MAGAATRLLPGAATHTACNDARCDRGASPHLHKGDEARDTPVRNWSAQFSCAARLPWNDIYLFTYCFDCDREYRKFKRR